MGSKHAWTLGSFGLGLGFSLAVAALCHVSFSWIGLNPTDDGFTLAYSRRLLDGQVPHRDFIIIRPFVSPLLHVPLLLVGGERTFWLSRLIVWWQLAAIAWLWTATFQAALERRLDSTFRIALALIAFAVSAHTFPIMAWHTIDALLLTAAGVRLIRASYGTWRTVGYLSLGLALLCKQSFLVAGPLAMLLFGDIRRLRCWSAWIAPGIAYALYCAAHGALADAVQQLSSHRDVLSTGIAPYLNRATAAGLAAGLFVGEVDSRWQWLDASSHAFWKRVIMSTAWLSPIFIAAWLLISGENLFGFGYAQFGFSIACVLRAARGPASSRSSFVACTLCALTAAWCASLSIGYNTPILAAGPLLIAPIAAVHARLSVAIRRRYQRGAIVASAAVILAAFAVGRMTHVYRDRAACELTEALDGVLPGAAGIRTNHRTAEFLRDLRDAASFAESRRSGYAILPDCAAFWVNAGRKNPLPIDWVQPVELSDPALLARVCDALSSMRGSITVIVQKVEANALADGDVVLGPRYPAVEFVRTHFARVASTKYFDLYE